MSFERMTRTGYTLVVARFRGVRHAVHVLCNPLFRHRFCCYCSNGILHHHVNRSLRHEVRCRAVLWLIACLCYSADIRLASTGSNLTLHILIKELSTDVVNRTASGKAPPLLLARTSLR